MSMAMKKTKSGITVQYTNTYNGMLEQGGVANRVVVVPWGAFPGIEPEVDFQASYNDLYTYEDVIRNVAMGRWEGAKPLRVIRKGWRIQ